MLIVCSYAPLPKLSTTERMMELIWTNQLHAVVGNSEYSILVDGDDGKDLYVWDRLLTVSEGEIASMFYLAGMIRGQDDGRRWGRNEIRNDFKKLMRHEPWTR